MNKLIVFVFFCLVAITVSAMIASAGEITLTPPNDAGMSTLVFPEIPIAPNVAPPAPVEVPKIAAGPEINLTQIINYIESSWAAMMLILLIIAAKVNAGASVLIRIFKPDPKSKWGSFLYTVALDSQKAKDYAESHQGTSGTTVLMLFLTGSLVSSSAWATDAAPAYPTPAMVAAVAAAAPKTFCPSWVKCSGGAAIQLSSVGFSKDETGWHAKAAPALGLGYALHFGLFPDATGDSPFTVSVPMYVSLSLDTGGIAFMPGLLVGIDWSGKTCSFGIVEDAWRLENGKMSGFLSGFTSLANTRFVFNLGVPIGAI